MDYRNTFLKLSYEKTQVFGHYCLAPNNMRAIYTNERASIEDFLAMDIKDSYNKINK